MDSLPADKRKLFRIVDRSELDKMGADSSAILALAAVPGLVFSGSLGPKQNKNSGPGATLQPNTTTQNSTIPNSTTLNSIQGIAIDDLFFSVQGGHHGYDPLKEWLQWKPEPLTLMTCMKKT